jgi:hypothetical protein
MIVYHGTYDGRLGRAPLLGQVPAAMPTTQPVAPPGNGTQATATPWLVSLMAAGAITAAILVASGVAGDWD